MKGIIRIAGLDFKGFSYVYWNLYVVREIVKRVKKEVGSSGITPVKTFFKVGKDRYRVDYLIITCTSSSWDRLKGELERRYVCVDSHFRFNKRRQSWVRTEVNFYREDELKDELADFPGQIEVIQYGEDIDDKNVLFEVKLDKNIDGPFYKLYTEFEINEADNYKKNMEIGYLVLSAERKWKRGGGEKIWRKRKAWKTVNGNYKEVG
jgi:hypothetical protein